MGNYQNGGKGLLQARPGKVDFKDKYSGKQRVFILEDHPIVRKGIAALINGEHDLLVCGEAESVEKALSAVSSSKPDIVLVDISLSGSSGIEFIRTMKMEMPETPCLALSMHDELLYAERILLEGAKGYLMKQEAMEIVLEAIRRVLAGKVYLSERVKERILEKKYGGGATDISPIEALSDRELEVFRLIGEGVTTAQIAKQLHRSAKTIETYRARIKHKLNLKHNMELVRHAIRWSQGT